MRNLNLKVQDQIQQDTTKPVDIYELYLGSQIAVDDNTLFFVASPDRLNFWDIEGTPQEFLPLGLQRSTVKHNIDLAVDYFNIALDNVDRAMSALIAATEFREKRVVLRTLFLDQKESPDDAILVFDGIIDKPVITEQSLNIQVVSRISLKLKTGRLYQLMCPWRFGGNYCGFSISATQSTGSVSAGSTQSLIIDPSRTEADNFWKHGIIEFTSGANVGAKRRITGYSLSSKEIGIDIVLFNTISIGDTFIIKQGCDKTLDWCKDTLANELNFGGFHTLPIELNEDIKEGE